MPGDAQSRVTTGILLYDGERDCLLLDGQLLQDGANIEIRVFDAWIPGLIERDSGGWYLITHDQVGIRLHTGLPARMYEEMTTVPASLQVSQELPPRILIVDDDPDLLRALSRTIMLRLRKVQVDAVDSANEALALLQRQPYDAVICDIKMPGMDGLALLGKIHEQQPEIPTLLITGHGEHELAIRALRGGAYDYIQKPIERDSFIAALLRAIQTCQLRRRVAEQQRTVELHARSLERLVQQRTHELVEAHAAKDKVISLVSHELAGPIARLREITQLLEQKIRPIEGTEIVLRSFAEIEQSLVRTEDLVRELQETTLIETRMFIPRRQQCDLIVLCHALLQEMTATNTTELTWETTGEAIEVEVDYDQIAQVLRTLLTHANISPLPDTPTTITLQRANREATIIVRDLGVETHLGVGFYVSRKILEQHGGHLEMQSFPGDRRTLFLTLPLMTKSDAADDNIGTIQPQTCATAIIRYQKSHEKGSY
jgi:FixJ family two-component response regulator